MRKWLLIVPGLCLLILIPAAIVNHLNGGSEPVTRDAPQPIDIDAIAGQSPEAVAAILGEPTDTGTADTFVQHIAACPCPELEYLHGTVQIMYVNGLADWITVQHTGRPVVSDQPEQYVFARSFPNHTYVEVATPSD